MNASIFFFYLGLAGGLLLHCALALSEPQHIEEGRCLELNKMLSKFNNTFSVTARSENDALCFFNHTTVDNANVSLEEVTNSSIVFIWEKTINNNNLRVESRAPGIAEVFLNGKLQSLPNATVKEVKLSNKTNDEEFKIIFVGPNNFKIMNGNEKILNFASSMVSGKNNSTVISTLITFESIIFYMFVRRVVFDFGLKDGIPDKQLFIAQDPGMTSVRMFKKFNITPDFCNYPIQGIFKLNSTDNITETLLSQSPKILLKFNMFEKEKQPRLIFENLENKTYMIIEVTKNQSSPMEIRCLEESTNAVCPNFEVFKNGNTNLLLNEKNSENTHFYFKYDNSNGFKKLRFKIGDNVIGDINDTIFSFTKKFTKDKELHYFISHLGSLSYKQDVEYKHYNFIKIKSLNANDQKVLNEQNGQDQTDGSKLEKSKILPKNSHISQNKIDNKLAFLNKDKSNNQNDNDLQSSSDQIIEQGADSLIKDKPKINKKPAPQIKINSKQAVSSKDEGSKSSEEKIRNEKTSYLTMYIFGGGLLIGIFALAIVLAWQKSVRLV